MISFSCPACGQGISVAEPVAGRPGKCPHCGSQVAAPEQYSGQSSTLVISKPRTKNTGALIAAGAGGAVVGLVVLAGVIYAFLPPSRDRTTGQTDVTTKGEDDREPQNPTASPSNSAASAETAGARVPKEPQTIELIPLIDLSRDRAEPGALIGRNNWSKLDGKLIYQSDNKAGLVRVPVSLFGVREYELAADLRSKAGEGIFSVSIPSSPKMRGMIGIGVGGNIVLSKGEKDRLTIGRWPDGVGKNAQVVVRVRFEGLSPKGWITVTVNGQTAAEWEGPLRLMGTPLEGHANLPKNGVINLLCVRDSFELSQLELRVYDGMATVLRGDPR
jgi:DNA-directed RNA polymerase subunit RPC12/RpoP